VIDKTDDLISISLIPQKFEETKAASSPSPPEEHSEPDPELMAREEISQDLLTEPTGE
jgi:hypothetical protein